MNDGEFFLSILKLIITLVFILCLAYVSIRFGLSRIYKPSVRTSYMKVVEQLYLGPKTLLILVMVGEEYFLLTSSNGQISGLEKLAGKPETLEHDQSDNERRNRPHTYTRFLGNAFLKRFFVR